MIPSSQHMADTIKTSGRKCGQYQRLPIIFHLQRYYFTDIILYPFLPLLQDNINNFLIYICDID